MPAEVRFVCPKTKRLSQQNKSYPPILLPALQLRYGHGLKQNKSSIFFFFSHLYLPLFVYNFWQHHEKLTAGTIFHIPAPTTSIAAATATATCDCKSDCGNNILR